jgi:hypothetical protein
MKLSSSVRALLALVVFALAATASDSRVQTANGNPRQDFLDKLVVAAIARTHHSVKYVSAYVRLDYPGGDVPADTGVCSDEIIRAYRAVGVDLQKKSTKTW